ncbi:DUF1236 domain-containing protein [Mesorhizobium sp. BAC0120]|uniref:DUF1236 domain-containing protein n=1 Tax=Mesorhizobium sp. BAC0120 TaxID=3090670 RepID=UPI00298C6E42|nr:DUF1236 domain-containing protein [Mesorhizobium sp. BAC0120]MDW6022248.1 DUF1236 domain-containing protein [Mesorhizobium sp. BAC0120]
MKHILLRTTMALALSVAGGAALAQTQQPNAGTDQSTGATMPKAEGQTGESMMPKKKRAGDTTAPKTEGQAGDTTSPKTEGQAGNNMAPKTEGQASETTTPKTEGQAGNNMAPKTQGQASESTTPKTEGQAQAPATNNETTGAIGKVNVTAQQKTEIRHIITQTKVEPAHVDFDVTVGATVPHTVKIHRLPQRIVKLVPAYESYEYFVLADGRIVIVDPDSLKVVAVLEA